jgi:hypothetical protein
MEKKFINSKELPTAADLKEYLGILMQRDFTDALDSVKELLAAHPQLHAFEYYNIDFKNAFFNFFMKGEDFKNYPVTIQNAVYSIRERIKDAQNELIQFMKKHNEKMDELNNDLKKELERAEKQGVKVD